MSRKAVIAVAAVVAIVAAGAALLIGGVGTATADEVRFQNVSEPGPDPFTPPAVASAGSGGSDSSGGSSDPSSESSGTESSEPTTPESSDPAAAGGSEGGGDQEPKPGTFGGTGDNKLCDREKLIEELSKDPQKLSAWAETVGIDADAQTVADFIRELRPSTLTEDTQVTNHSFSGGEAKAYQAILKKGTAVLVDDEGNPVARCRCGNPLTEPLQLEAETKCYECPANYTPPPPCEGECHRPEPEAPPVKPVGTPPGTTGTGTGAGTPDSKTTQVDPIAAAKKALDECRQTRGSLGLCQAEYVKANGLCKSDPLNAACDVTVCFDPTSISVVSACPSILGQEDIRFQCSFSGSPEQCEKLNFALRDRCVNNPTPVPACVNHSGEGLAFNLRGNCKFKPDLPECKSLQLGCVKDRSQVGCAELQNKCVEEPSRPDCRAASEALQKCAKDPTLPECKGVDPKKAPAALRAEEEPTDEPVQEPTGDEGAGGEDPGTGTDTGGDTGGGEAPTTEPAPDTTTPPEGE